MKTIFIPRQIIFLFILISNLSLLACSPPDNYRIKNTSKKFPPYLRENIIKTAKSYLGTNYKAGGQSPEGFDCSGFTLYVFKESGIHISRTSTDQYYWGSRKTLKSAKPGDLLFFQIDRNKISHVGIYAGGSEFIHSPGAGKHVSYASMENSYWKRRYVGTVSYFND